MNSQFYVLKCYDASILSIITMCKLFKIRNAFV